MPARYNQKSATIGTGIAKSSLPAEMPDFEHSKVVQRELWAIALPWFMRVYIHAVMRAVLVNGRYSIGARKAQPISYL